MTTKRTSVLASAAKRAIPISRVELARFVKRLSFLYNDALTGNAELSRALSDLSTELMRHERTSSAKKKITADLRHRTILSNLNAASVQQLLDDPSLTKSDITLLASERFSIAPAKLQKMTLEDVRQTVRTALRNEEALHIISAEASRGASNRSS